jgi:uridine kinase
MNKPLSFDEAAALLHSIPLSVEMIAIDGLPLAGKSTLADRFVREFGFALLAIDSFVQPGWTENFEPGYPFAFFRLDEFHAAIRALRNEGMCAFYPYDWEGDFISPDAQVIYRDKPIVIEGASTLDPALVDSYDLRFFVDSDEASLMDARQARDGSVSRAAWERLVLPSVAAYMRTGPADRADFIVRGRGA